MAHKAGHQTTHTPFAYGFCRWMGRAYASQKHVLFVGDTTHFPDSRRHGWYS